MKKIFLFALAFMSTALLWAASTPTNEGNGTWSAEFECGESVTVKATPATNANGRSARFVHWANINSPSTPLSTSDQWAFTIDQAVANNWFDANDELSLMAIFAWNNVVNIQVIEVTDPNNLTGGTDVTANNVVDVTIKNGTTVENDFEPGETATIEINSMDKCYKFVSWEVKSNGQDATLSSTTFAVGSNYTYIFPTTNPYDLDITIYVMKRTFKVTIAPSSTNGVNDGTVNFVTPAQP